MFIRLIQSTLIFGSGEGWMALWSIVALVLGGHATASEGPARTGSRASEVSQRKKQVVGAMKQAFGDKEKQVAHAMQVTECAERLLDVTGSKADPLTVVVAAILHDIGRCITGTTDHERDGAVVSRQILTELEFDKKLTDHVSRIVGSHHSAKNIDTPEFRIVWIADRLVNHKRDCPDKKKLRQEYVEESTVLDQKIRANKAKSRQKKAHSPDD